MKKVLIALAVSVVLVIWVISWFRTPEAVATSGGREWPAGLGTLDAVKTRYTEQKASDGAVKLQNLGKALPRSEPIENYVFDEIARAEPVIAEPPPVPEIAPIRELLLREPIVWERHAGVVEVGSEETSRARAIQMTVARALITSALAKGRANDATAWDDLHAVWNLSRSLEGHPQLMQQTAAFSMARMINGVAWKMPLPAPAWLAELQARDHVKPLLEAFQYSAASYWADGAQLFPTKFLADSVDHDRQIATELAATKNCDVQVRPNKLGVDISSIWRRVFRYTAEREATANALRVREGKPIETASKCADGTWTLDGTTLKFSRAIETAPPDKPLPLVLCVK